MTTTTTEAPSSDRVYHEMTHEITVSYFDNPTRQILLKTQKVFEQEEPSIVLTSMTYDLVLGRALSNGDSVIQTPRQKRKLYYIPKNQESTAIDELIKEMKNFSFNKRRQGFSIYNLL